MSKVLVQTAVRASVAVLKAELALIGSDIYPNEVLSAYIQRLEEWDISHVITASKVVSDIKISPFSYSKLADKYYFEGNSFAMVDDITDYVVHNHYGLITDETEQLVYYIET